jgi:two-component system chemotaxis response regulator CheB
VELRRGHVYIAPPDRHLTLTALETFHLDHGPKIDFHRPAADALFKSAAIAFGPRVIGVVLTGGDGDGTEGLKAMHATGGLSIVQDPSEALAPSMPRHAITGDHPDFVVKLADMADLICRLVEGDERAIAASAPG